MSDGLAFVEAPATKAKNNTQSDTTATTPSMSNAGIDSSGFMKVFVVNGGINFPNQAYNIIGQNTANPSTPTSNNHVALNTNKISKRNNTKEI
jgi:hypothetical protein